LDNRVIDTGFWRVFRVPVFVGLLSLFGLMAALLSADFGRYFGWMAVGSPLMAILWFRFQPSRRAR
jgi:hypothetical protein